MNLNIYSWREKFAQDGLSPALRFELREILTPHVRISPPFKWHEEQTSERTERDRIGDLVNWEIVLGGDHIVTALRDLAKSARWRDVVHELLPEATALLRDALDLMRELEGADDHHDHSYSAQPSISPHAQNRNFNDWTALIELARDAWTASASKSPEIAKLEVERWLAAPYPVFKRLAFFAAAETALFPPERVLTWLLSDGGWWLWSTETQREAMRLLVSLSPRLTAPQREELQLAILVGPPRAMFREDVEPDQFERLSNHETWLRLSKIKSSGVELSDQAVERMDNLSNQYPNWALQADERDEFPVWMGTGDEWTKLQISPKQRRGLEEFLQQAVSSDAWHEDDWRSRCLNDFPRAATALLSLGLRGHWPSPRWREALQAWSTETHARPSWRFLSKVLDTASETVIKDISHSLAWWLQTVGRQVEVNEVLFFNLVNKVLAVNKADSCDPDPDIVFRAINHPVGLATDAVLRWWYRRKLQDGQKLEPSISGFFTTVCDLSVEIFRYGRVQLATHSVALFRVDQQWTERHLLGLFDWSLSSLEASAAWKGFLISPRLFRPLIAAIKQPLLETARRYDELHELGRQYASLLTFAALELDDVFSPSELAIATASLPINGLEVAAHTLIQALNGTDTQRAEYWRNRIVPYLKRVWPKNRNNLTPTIARHFAELCTATGDAFPDAVVALKDWYTGPSDASYVVHQLGVRRLPALFPVEALVLLDAVVNDNASWAPLDLRKCLDELATAQPTLRSDARFQRLDAFERRRGLRQ